MPVRISLAALGTALTVFIGGQSCATWHTPEPKIEITPAGDSHGQGARYHVRASDISTLDTNRLQSELDEKAHALCASAMKSDGAYTLEGIPDRQHVDDPFLVRPWEPLNAPLLHREYGHPHEIDLLGTLQCVSTSS